MTSLTIEVITDSLQPWRDLSRVSVIHGHRFMLPCVLQSSSYIVEDETSMSRCCSGRCFSDRLIIWLVYGGTTMCPVRRMNVVDCHHVGQR